MILYQYNVENTKDAVNNFVRFSNITTYTFQSLYYFLIYSIQDSRGDSYTACHCFLPFASLYFFKEARSQTFAKFQPSIFIRFFAALFSFSSLINPVNRMRVLTTCPDLWYILVKLRLQGWSNHSHIIMTCLRTSEGKFGQGSHCHHSAFHLSISSLSLVGICN